MAIFLFILVNIVLFDTNFREHGVDKMFKLGNSIPQWKNPIRLYLIPSIYSCAESVANQIAKDSIPLTKTLQFHVISKLILSMS